MKKFLLMGVFSILLFSTILASYPTSIESKGDLQSMVSAWSDTPEVFLTTLKYACLHPTGLASNQATKVLISYGYDPFTNTYDYTKTYFQCSKTERLDYNKVKVSLVWYVKGIDMTQLEMNNPLTYYNSYNSAGLSFLIL